MIRKLGFSLTLLIAVAVASAARAEKLKVQPGWWKTTETTTKNGKTKPERSSNHCVTQEEIDGLGEKFAVPVGKQVTCSRLLFKETATSLDLKFECTGDYTLTREASLKFTSPTHYTGRMHTTGQRNNRTLDATTTLESTRIGECPAFQAGQPALH